jgi:acyl carrier protein
VQSRSMNTDLDTVTRQVIDALAANPKVSGPITGATVIVDDLGLDSLTLMNFVMEIEDKLDVSVPLDRLANIRTIDDLARCLAELKARR